jgi:hypothetical protein
MALFKYANARPARRAACVRLDLTAKLPDFTSSPVGAAPLHLLTDLGFFSELALNQEPRRSAGRAERSANPRHRARLPRLGKGLPTAPAPSPRAVSTIGEVYRGSM